MSTTAIKLEMVEEPLNVTEYLKEDESEFSLTLYRYLKLSPKTWTEVKNDLQFAPSIKLSQLTPPIYCPIQMHYIESPSEEYALIAASYYIKYLNEFEDAEYMVEKQESMVYQNPLFEEAKEVLFKGDFKRQ